MGSKELTMDLFGAPRVTKLFKSDSVKHDNSLFRLHHQVNYFFVLIGVLFIFGQNHFGSPIKCYQERDGYVEQYCWFHGSGHLPPGLSKHVTGCAADQRLFGPDGRGKQQEGDRRHTKYYLWLPFTLGLCLAIIKTPRFIWKTMGERGVMRSILDSDTAKEMASRITDLRTDGSCKYFMSFIFCEILNIISILLCITTLDALLGGNFWDYGSKVHEFYSTSEDDRVSLGLTNPMCNVFPTPDLLPGVSGLQDVTADGPLTFCCLAKVTLSWSGSEAFFQGFNATGSQAVECFSPDASYQKSRKQE